MSILDILASMSSLTCNTAFAVIVLIWVNWG